MSNSTVKFTLTEKQANQANNWLENKAEAVKKTTIIKNYIWTQGSENRADWKYIDNDSAQKGLVWFGTNDPVYEETTDGVTTTWTDATEDWKEKNLLGDDDASVLINLLIKSSGSYNRNDWVYSITGVDENRTSLEESTAISLDIHDRRLDDSTGTLTIEPNVIFNKTIDVKGTSTLEGNVLISNDSSTPDPTLTVEGDTTLNKTTVNGLLTANDTTSLRGTTEIGIENQPVPFTVYSDNAQLNGILQINSTTTINGISTFNNDTFFKDDVTIGTEPTETTPETHSLVVFESTSLKNGLSVNGDSHFENNITIDGEIYNDRIPSLLHTDDNEFADKFWTNSSIATATATFQGSYAPKDYGYEEITSTTGEVTRYDTLDLVPFPYLTDGQEFSVGTEESHKYYKKKTNYPKTDSEIATWLGSIINNPPETYEIVDDYTDLPEPSATYLNKYYWVEETNKYYKCVENETTPIAYEWKVYNCADNNDYCFFQIWEKADSDNHVYFPTPQGEDNSQPVEISYKRFKFVQSTNTWQFEYQLNNSGFTANQWAAINSGITSSWIKNTEDTLAICLKYADFDPDLFYLKPKAATGNYVSISEAGENQSGIVNYGEQSIYGLKTFVGSLEEGKYSYTFKKKLEVTQLPNINQAENGCIYHLTEAQEGYTQGSYYIAKIYGFGTDDYGDPEKDWEEIENFVDKHEAIHVEGKGNLAIGDFSHAEGLRNYSVGQSSHSEGTCNNSYGNYSHTEGINTNANGVASHAEGAASIATGINSHSEGEYTKAIGENSHAEGISTEANGQYSHSEGKSSKANKIGSHAEGYTTIADGEYSHAEGNSTHATGNYSHSEGQETIASLENSHAEGKSTKAQGKNSHAEGNSTIASGYASHAEGDSSSATGDYSHAEGYYTTANGNYSSAKGNHTSSYGVGANTSGYYTSAYGDYSYAEGYNTKSGKEIVSFQNYSYFPIEAESADAEKKYYAESDYTDESGIKYSKGYYDCKKIAISNETIISYTYIGLTYQSIDHAEGKDTKALGNYSHAEGSGSKTYGAFSHAEGAYTESFGPTSHTEGANTRAGYQSHAEGDRSSTYIDQVVIEELPEIEDAEFGIIYIPTNSSRESIINNHCYIMRQTDLEGTREWFDLKETNIFLDPGTSHAQGRLTISLKQGSHSEGSFTLASNYDSHAEGKGAVASGENSHAEGCNTIASGEATHAEGIETKAGGKNSHTEGYKTLTILEELEVEELPEISEAEYGTAYKLSNDYYIVKSPTTSRSWLKIDLNSYSYTYYNNAHAEGKMNQAIGANSHAEGEGTVAFGSCSHTEGEGTVASNNNSHAEGSQTTASGYYSHAEGWFTTASGQNSHAQGWYTLASGNCSHAEGLGTIASGSLQHVQGKYNIEDTSNVYADIIGAGTGYNTPNNAYALTWTGEGRYLGDLYTNYNFSTNVGNKVVSENCDKTAAGTYVYKCVIDSNGNKTYSWELE